MGNKADNFTIRSSATCYDCEDDLLIMSSDYKYGFHVTVAPCNTCLEKLTDDKIAALHTTVEKWMNEAIADEEKTPEFHSLSQAIHTAKKLAFQQVLNLFTGAEEK